jgi:hypothetical protein
MEENKNLSAEQAGTEPKQPVENIPKEITTSDESAMPEAEATAIHQPQTSNNQPQTQENMDVHHHGHVHEKKKWKEYLFQFLMLFLAVFCGFLAEYQLEHKIEKDRAKELAASFYNELISDSVTLATVKNFRERKYTALKYLQGYFQDSSIINCSNTFTIQLLYGYYTFSPSFFEPGDAILEQLKNSGSLRYFKSRNLQKLTGDLSVAIANLRKRNAFEEVFYRENIWPFLVKYNDMKWYESIVARSNDLFVTFSRKV